MKELNFDTIIGIDPGANGGIAIWRPNEAVKTVKMPRDIKEITELMTYYREISRPLVILEKVQLRSDDITANPGKAFRIQQLLMSFQQLKDYITIAGVPYVLVHPISWQSYLKLRKKNEEKTERKNRYKQAAAYYYPNIKTTLWNADALLLMHFGRVKMQQEPEWISASIPDSAKRKLDFAK